MTSSLPRYSQRFRHLDHCYLCYIVYYILCYIVGKIIIILKFVNDAIASARAGSPLYGLAPIEDPSGKIIEVHLAALKWNILWASGSRPGEAAEQLSGAARAPEIEFAREDWRAGMGFIPRAAVLRVDCFQKSLKKELKKW